MVSFLYSMISLCCGESQETQRCDENEYVEIKDQDFVEQQSISNKKKSTSKNSSPIPNEIMCHICSYLKVNDLIYFSMTCKDVRALLKENSYVDFYSRFIRVFLTNLSYSESNFWNSEISPFYNVYRINFSKGSHETTIYKKNVVDAYSSNGVILKERIFPQTEIVIGEIVKVTVNRVSSATRPIPNSRFGVAVIRPQTITKSQIVGAKLFGQLSSLTQEQVLVINEVISKINRKINVLKV